MMRRSLTRVLATAARQAKVQGGHEGLNQGASRVLGSLGWERAWGHAQGMHAAASQVEPQDEEPTALPQGGTGAQSYPHKPESALCSEGRGSRQWRREPRSSGSENTSERASTLYQQLEALSNAGDAVGVRKAFDDVLFPALRQQKAAREAGTADFQFPPALLSPVNWRLYLLALERSNAHPHLIGQRMHLLHSLGVPPQVAGYVALLRRAAEGNLGLLAYQKLLEMRDKGLEPTMACYLSAASACLRSEQPGYAKRIFEMIRSANPPCARPQSVQFGKLCMHAIREFARLSRFQYVFDLMDDLEARGLAVPTFLVTDVMHMAAIEGKTEPLLRCVQRLEAVKQYFKVANPAGGDPLEVARPLKLDEGSLLDVLGVAANKGDAELASATWALLLRSLSLPKCPDYYTTKDEELEEGEDPGLDPTEHLPGAQQEPTGESVQSTAAGTAAESATESPFFTAPTPSASKAQQAEQARHTARLPQIASYQALVHAYANAHAFRPMFEAIRELEQQYPAVPEAVAYYGGLQPAVDALAHSTLLIDDAYYLLEGMANEGQQLTATQLNVVVAACSQVGDMKRALETFDQYEALGVRPDADAYNAILQGCVESGLLDTLDKVLAEMQSQGVAPNAHTHSLVVERGIVSGDVAGMMGALRQMEAAGHEPKTRLLERCVARCERAGDRENMKLLLERLFRNEYRIVGMDAMVKRWQSEGGVVTLTGSSKWINREEVVQEVQNSHGRYIQLPWQRQREQQQLDVQREGRRPRQQQQQQQYGQRDGGPGRRYQRQERQQAQREGPQRRQQREQRDGYGQRPEYQQEGEQGRGGRERQQGRYQGQRREYQQQ